MTFVYSNLSKSDNRQLSEEVPRLTIINSQKSKTDEAVQINLKCLYSNNTILLSFNILLKNQKK